jgi:hypothetical protein
VSKFEQFLFCVGCAPKANERWSVFNYVLTSNLTMERSVMLVKLGKAQVFRPPARCELTSPAEKQRIAKQSSRE